MHQVIIDIIFSKHFLTQYILDKKPSNNHCVKSVQIRSFFWSVFSCIRTEFGDLLLEPLYSVRIQDYTDQKKLYIWTLFMQ